MGWDYWTYKNQPTDFITDVVLWLSTQSIIKTLNDQVAQADMESVRMSRRINGNSRIGR